MFWLLMLLLQHETEVSVTNKDKNNKKILNEIKQQVEFEDFNEE